MYKNNFNADNTTKPNVSFYPMVIGNNNNENSSPLEPIHKDSKNFFSEPMINEIQSFVSEQLREKDTAENVTQTSNRDNNKSESFISDQAKDPDINANTMQMRNKRKHKKKKSNSKLDISESNRNRC